MAEGRRLAVLDWKSGKDVLAPRFKGYQEHPIQLAAYAEAYNLQAVADGRDMILASGNVYLDKVTGDPRYIDSSMELEANYMAFCALREYYRLKIEPTASDRRYYEYGGDKFPSVTTILGVLDKPALVQWAANCAVDCVREAIPEIRKPKTTPTRIEQILDSAKKDFRQKSKTACDVGTLIHDAIQIHLAGGDPSHLLDGNEAATNGFIAFLQWASTVKLEPLALEQKLFHPPLRYAGTPDFIGYVTLNGNGAAAVPAEKEEDLDVF